MNKKLYNYLRIKFAADAQPQANSPWYVRAGKAVASPFVDIGKTFWNGMSENARQLSTTSDASETSARQINDQMYNEAIAALQRGEDPGYDPYAGSYVSSLGGQAYDLQDDYDEAMQDNNSQQQQQNNQPVINVNLPENYGAGGGGAGGGGGGGMQAPPSRPGLADYISNYSSKAGY